MPDEMMRGSCLCGAVAFEVTQPLRDVVACHCAQCRKQSGHYWAATSAPHAQFRLTREEGLVWYRASPAARRGHCGRCGAMLFWQREGEARISFSPGALEGITGLHIARHILAEEGGDYYPESTAEHPPPGDRLRGSCLCGGCAFNLPAPAGGIIACHCTQCRRLSGHFSASFDLDEAELVWERRDTLAEYGTPACGMRGFCSACGASLWFRATGGAFSVEAGAIDGATGGKLVRHIFTANKGDYYDLEDGLPQFLAAEP
ncbi:MAG: GFA family protein [Gemmobacter sp.]|jgi:hypothetical protein|nr:GFA family protein [Gemmobacter sp.]